MDYEAFDFYPQPIWLMVKGVVKQYPRRIFNDSPIFADMLALPQPAGQPVEGTSRDHPLRLDGVRLKEMGQFARVVECWAMKSIPQDMLAEEWVNVLRLASMWEMDTLRAHVISHLTKHFQETEEDADAAVQVRAALDNDVADWKLAGFYKLLARRSELSAADIRLLGPDLAAAVLQRHHYIFTQEKVNMMQNHVDIFHAAGECECTGYDPVQLCQSCKDMGVMTVHELLQLPPADE